VIAAAHFAAESPRGDAGAGGAIACLVPPPGKIVSLRENRSSHFFLAALSIAKR